MNLIFLILILLVSAMVQYYANNILFERNKYHLSTFFFLSGILIYFNSSFDAALLIGGSLTMCRVFVTYFRQALTVFLRTYKGEAFWFNLFCIEQLFHCFVCSSIFFTLF